MSEVLYANNVDIRQEMSSGATAGMPGFKKEAQIHESLLTRSATRATREVNGMLETTYPTVVPWGASGDVPVLIRSITEDLAVYYAKRSLHPGPGPMSDDVKEEYYDRPMATLQKIQDREVLLNEIPSDDYPDVYHNNDPYYPVFDMDDVIDQRVDPDRLDDIADKKE